MSGSWHRGERRFGATLGAVLLLLPCAAGATELAVTLEPATATVGDRVEAVLLLSGAAEELTGEPRFPAWDERWGGAEILEVGPVESVTAETPAGFRFRQRLVLTAFRTGVMELPPKQVAVPGPLATAEVWTPAELALRVESVLPPATSGEELDPRPPAPPAALPLGRAFWSTFAVMAGLAAAALVLARQRHALPVATARPRSASEELAAALAAATAAPTPEAGHVVLSLGLRRFLGRRFGFSAAESTTSEIRRELRGRRCPAALEGRVHEILLACDRVKFAREPATRPALEARVVGAREVAEAADLHLQPAEAEAGAGRDTPGEVAA